MRRVVVIDDEAGIRRTVEIVLTRAGYEVLLAANGNEGMRLCRETAPDLVITDIHMPGADGFETIACLRTVYPGLPVIAISGGDATERLELLGSASLLGAVSSLRKPFTVRELLEAVHRALGSGMRAGEA
jgi:DNA-binding NtrC family response regulator